jgi:hypothetical protein
MLKKPLWYESGDCDCDDYEDCKNTQGCLSNAVVDLQKCLRMLWEQHVVWTRLTIISMAASLPCEGPTTNRLLRNAKDFGMAFRPFYGKEVASTFSQLIKDHLVIAGQLVAAAKAGKSKAAANIEKDWYANADEIAHFLNSINGYWSIEETMKMWHEHLALTKAEVIAILTGNYVEGIELFDEIENRAIMMADTQADGIVKQFPDMFMEC